MGKLELVLETDKVCMYSPKYDGEEQNEFRKFLLANRSHGHPQLKNSSVQYFLSSRKWERPVLFSDIFVPKAEMLRLFRHMLIFLE